MDVSTTEFWDVDGVPLNSYCWAIKSYGGSRQSLPNLRGDNKLVPKRPGRRFAPKIADSKVITLAMWVVGVDPDTNVPSRHSQAVQWNDNWDALRRLVFTPEREVALTKRWLRNAASPELVQATAAAQIAGAMEPNMTGRTRADFAIDFLLADPYFYGDEISSITIPLNTDFTVVNPGDVKVMHNSFNIEFEGDLVNPTLQNKTNGAWMKINTLIPSGTNVNVDVASFKATRSSDGTSVAQTISQGGERHWMALEPGNNVMRLDSSGTGVARLTFRPAYL